MVIIMIRERECQSHRHPYCAPDTASTVKSHQRARESSSAWLTAIKIKHISYGFGLALGSWTHARAHLIYEWAHGASTRSVRVLFVNSKLHSSHTVAFYRCQRFSHLHHIHIKNSSCRSTQPSQRRREREWVRCSIGMQSIWLITFTA